MFQHHRHRASDGSERSFHLRADLARVWAPERDTTALYPYAVRDATPSADDLEREIFWRCC